MPCGAIDLQDKIAVVTGGGSGINLAFSKLAVQQGAKVLIADLRLTDEGRIFVDNAASSSSPTVVFVKCDVRKRADLENLITVSRDTFGSVPDVYIAGAGVFEPVCTFFLPGASDPASYELRTVMVELVGRYGRRRLCSNRGQCQPRAQVGPNSHPSAPVREQTGHDTDCGLDSRLCGNFFRAVSGKTIAPH